ncbi:unnamed protein product [Urochloa humidicola]
MPKRRRDDGEADGPPTTARRHEERRLYLIFDDYPWGYSVREMNLPPPPSSHRDEAGSASASGEPRRRLPPPIICFEAPRGRPLNFAAVGTAIVSTHSRRDPSGDNSVPDRFVPIVDVRWRGVTFGPGQAYYHTTPIYLPAAAGDAVFALDASTFSHLSLAPLWPPRLEGQHGRPHLGIHGEPPWWAWRDLPQPPFNTLYDAVLISYAVAGDDGRTLLFSAEIDDEIEATLLPDGVTVVFGEVTSRPATFAFDTAALAWERRGEWALPFAGRAHFVPCLDAFVGFSRDPDTSGHPCSCSAAAVAAAEDGGGPPAWKLCKEKLFSEDPAETHVGATLLYMENGSEFCLVECVSIDEHGDGDDAATDQEEEPRRRCCYLYRLTTFSLSYDDDGDLTTAGTCRVQCYKVPEETTEKLLRNDPVAFWL